MEFNGELQKEHSLSVLLVRVSIFNEKCNRSLFYQRLNWHTYYNAFKINECFVKLFHFCEENTLYMYSLYIFIYTYIHIYMHRLETKNCAH